MVGISKEKGQRLLNMSELCREIGYSEPTVRKWLGQEGFPIRKGEEVNRYTVAEVFRWRVEHEKNKSNGTDPSEKRDLKSILIKKEEESYRKLKIKNDLDEGILTVAMDERKSGFTIGRVLFESLQRMATLNIHKIRKAKTDKQGENLLLELISEVLNGLKERLFEEEN